MNWGRAKSVLIILFLLVDVFLVYVLMQVRSNAKLIPEEIVTATIHALETREITIGNDVIPRERGKNRNVIMRNHFEDPVRTAEEMLSNFEVKKADEKKREYQFEDKTAVLYVTDAGLHYRQKREPVPYHIKNLPSDESISGKIAGYLSKLGFNKRDLSIVNGRWEDGLYRCTVIPVFDDVKIYGIEMQIKADRQNLLQIEGTWFRPVEAEAYDDEPLMDITSVLAGMVYKETYHKMPISRLENAFYAGGDYLQSREIAAVPVYVLIDSNGRRFYFDSRTGQEIGQQ